MRLSVGFATRDDYHGAWMTVNGLLAYHGHVVDQIIIVDNSPKDSKHAKELEAHVKTLKKVKYVRAIGEESSCVHKGRVFTESNCEYAACCDSHVLFEPGALQALVEFWDAQPSDTRDLATGPCLVAADKVLGTNQAIYESEGYRRPDGAQLCAGDSLWRGGCMGCWVKDPRADSDQPFKIMQQGTGFFSMRREAWVGFDPAFLGHGGNETYMFEKVRQRGGQAYCIPQARWIHRFGRPDGIPYSVKWEARVRNYLHGFIQLGRYDLVEAVKQHFPKVCPDSLAKALTAVGLSGQPGKPKQSAVVRQGTPVKQSAVKRALTVWAQAGNKIDGGSAPRKMLEEIERLTTTDLVTLELGSGVTTVLFDQIGCNHLALEHNIKWVEKVAPLLKRARIAPCALNQSTPPTYDIVFDDVYDLVVIDGPPNVKGGELRDGCLELLRDALSPSATIIVDDTHRPGEKRLVERLCRAFRKNATRLRDGARSFDVLTPSTDEVPASELPCVHRSGDGARVTCCPRTNGGRDVTRLYNCAVHGKCTVSGVVENATTCVLCPDRQNPEPQDRPGLTRTGQVV